MAKLSVKDGVFRYKSTSYQISQIVSIEPFEQTRHINNNYIKTDHLPNLWLWAVGIFLAALFLLYLGWKNQSEGLWLVIAPITISGFIIYYCIKTQDARKAQNSLPTSFIMYGFSIWLSNNREQSFESSNKDTIDKTLSAINDTMLGVKGVNVSFADANIQITDSENVNIGNITA